MEQIDIYLCKLKGYGNAAMLVELWGGDFRQNM